MGLKSPERLPDGTILTLANGMRFALGKPSRKALNLMFPTALSGIPYVGTLIEENIPGFKRKTYFLRQKPMPFWDFLSVDDYINNRNWSSDTENGIELPEEP